ncbi:MAG: Gfo/Idh/MocA family oxidoreductase [Bryobacteraceae bacterium]|nr:Gfo/Idh/MocA family oxidoreductase [Bryobacterales bacterium]NUN03431.1 Gfo/Idh/MocA family oxidoreductase [Bryobacteraceae bacterium]
MNELLVGIVGFGYTGRLHLAACRQLPGVRVVAVADNSAEALSQVPSDLKTFRDYRDLLALDIDIVNICLPTAAHAAAACNALRARKHVLVEKPIATTTADARLMMEEAKEAGCLLYTGMTHRFYPEIREAKKRVEEGQIGDVVLIRDSIFESLGFLGGPAWYRSKALAGGGTVLSSGVHLVDRVLWFAGRVPVSVSGFTSNAILGGEVEDSAQMCLGFDGSCFAQITFGWLRESHPLLCDLELTGTRGSLVVHTWQGYEHRSARGVQQYTIYKSESHQEKVLVGLRGEILEFCTAVREGREPWPCVRETNRALRVVEAFYEAAQTGAVVALKGTL